MLHFIMTASGWTNRCPRKPAAAHIDLSVLTELLKSDKIANKPFANEGEVAKVFRDLALDQLDGIVAREEYRALDYRSPTIRSEDIEKADTLVAMADSLYARAEAARASIQLSDKGSWAKDFLNRCTARRGDLEVVWEASWKEQCDGKRLFRDFQKAGHLKIALSAFKSQIVGRMRDTSSDNWRIVESNLRRLIGGSRSA